jgi:hypothetical protein
MARRASTPNAAGNGTKVSAKSVKQSSTFTSAGSLYRRLALALPGAIESSHMGAADFRVNGKIFATLAYQAKGLGTVMLTPEQQADCLKDAPGYFTPAPGKWGQNGTSLVRLDAPEDVIAGALTMAHRNVVQRSTKPNPRGSL